MRTDLAHRLTLNRLVCFVIIRDTRTRLLDCFTLSKITVHAAKLSPNLLYTGTVNSAYQRDLRNVTQLRTLSQ